MLANIEILPAKTKNIYNINDSKILLKSMGIILLEEYGESYKVLFPFGWQKENLVRCPGWTIYKNNFWWINFYVYDHPILCGKKWITTFGNSNVKDPKYGHPGC